MGAIWDRFSKNWGVGFSSEEDAAESAPETTETTEETPGFFSRAWDWTANTATPWTADKFAYVGAPFVEFGSEYILDLPDKILGTDIYNENNSIAADSKQRVADMVEGTVEFGKFVANDKSRAGGLATQGVVSGAASLVGLGYDISIGALTNYVVRPTVNGLTNLTIQPAYNLYNMVTEDDYKPTDLHWDRWGFFAGTETISEHTQLRDLPEGLTNALYIDREGFDHNFGDIKAEIIDENGDLIQNPYANYERTLLYGPQMATEAVVFTGVGAVTMGWGGAALATVRGSSWAGRFAQIAEESRILSSIKAATTDKFNIPAGAVGTAEQVRHADIVHDMAHAAKKIETAELNASQMVTGAMDDLRRLKEAGGSAEDIVKAEVALAQLQETTKEAVRQAQLQLESLKTAEELAKAQAALAQAEAEASRQTLQAQERLANIKGPAASTDEIAKAERALERASTKGNKLIETATHRAYGTSEPLRKLRAFNKAGDKLDEAEEALLLAGDKLGDAKAALRDAPNGPTPQLSKELEGAQTAFNKADEAYTTAANKLDEFARDPTITDMFLQRTNGSVLTEAALQNARHLSGELRTANQAVDIAKAELKGLKKGGASADEIAEATEKLADARDGVKAAVAASRVNPTTGSTEMAQTFGERLHEGFKTGYYKGMNRWFNIIDHPVLETGIGGAMTVVSVKIAENAAEDKIEEQSDSISRSTAESAMSGTDRTMDNIVWGNISTPTLTDQFPTDAPSANDPDGGIKTNTPSLNTVFGNRSDGLVQPIEDGAFKIDISESQLNILKQSYGN